MTEAGVWDQTTVLVTSDHASSAASEIDGQDDPRVPFMLKLAGQTSAVSYEPVLPTVVTKPLLEAIIEGKVATSEDATAWLAEHSR